MVVRKIKAPAGTRVEIDLGAFRRNLSRIIRVLKPGTRVLLVVKSDAYGHGVAAIAREAIKFSQTVYLGVASFQEALKLRKAGIQKPVLILGVVHPREAETVIRLNITSAVSSYDEALMINRAALRIGKKARVHVELDTGMGRLGVWCAEAVWLLHKVGEMRHLELEGAFTHFPSADEDDPKFSVSQIEIFTKAIDIANELLKRPLKFVHMANSTGLVTFGDSHFSLVRPGIMVYGVNPSKRPAPFHLKPVLSLKSEVSFLKSVEKGRTISYARTYVAPRATRIATVPVGYSAGYPLGLSNKGWVLIRGERFPVVGRVTMDHLMVDLGERTDIRRWDEVTLIGRSRDAEIRAEELAGLSGTIPYAILTGLSPHIPRVYRG